MVTHYLPLHTTTDLFGEYPVAKIPKREPYLHPGLGEQDGVVVVPEPPVYEQEDVFCPNLEAKEYANYFFNFLILIVLILFFYRAISTLREAVKIT